MLRNVQLYLIKPTQYDDDGYVVRHWRGVLPSNTLACLAGLTEELIAQKRLGESVQVKIHVFDETVDKIPVKSICRSQRRDYILSFAFSPLIQGGSRMCRSARTDLCGGRSVMLVPTASLSPESVSGRLSFSHIAQVWQNHEPFRKNLRGNPIKILTLQEILSDQCSKTKTNVASSEVGRSLQDIKASGWKP
jgi:hypothetical protein